MAEVDKERSVFESLLSALGKPGSLARQALIENIEGKKQKGSFGDILSGRLETTPDDLIQTVENKYGIDLTPGSRNWEEKSFGEKAATMGRDFVIDVFTSPDSLIGAPAKLAGGAKYLKHLSPAKRKLAERAITGATLGYLSSNEDDSLIDTMGKVATGAAVGRYGGKVLQNIGTKTAEVGEKYVLDPIIENFNEKAFQELRGIGITTKFSEAARIAKKSEKKARGRVRRFYNATKQVEGDLIKNLKNAGASDEQIREALSKYDTILGQGFGSQIRFRNAFKSVVKNLQENIPEGISESQAGLRKIMADDGLDDLYLSVVEDAKDVVKSAGKNVIDDRSAGMLGTSVANDIYNNHVIKLAQDGEFGDEISDAVFSHINKNEQLVKEFNSFAKKTLNKGDDDFRFIPIGLHTTDLRNLDKVIDEDVAMAASRVGARQRLGDLVETTAEGITREQAREVGAERFARLFLTRRELDAKRVLMEVGKSSRDAKGALPALFRGYDELLKLTKTVHLTTGANWVVNNFSDNILRSYIAAGPKAASRTLGENVGVGLWSVGNIATSGALKKLDKDSLYSKMFDVFDPHKNVKRLDYDDDWMNAAAHVGVIESDKFQDFYDQAKRGEALLNVTKNASAQKEMMEYLAQRGPLLNNIDEMQKFFWDKVGRIGSANENTARYITFQEVFKTMDEIYPLADKAIKKYGAEGVLVAGLRAPKKDAEMISQGAKAIKQAGKIVNDAFFDYGDVHTFEKYVMKRIFPYWTFISRNFKFWVDKIADPEAVARVAKVESVSQALGKAPTGDERLGIPNYLLEKGARLRGDEVLTMPNLSIVDGVTADPSEIGNKLAPAIKQPIQQIFNIDMFTGQPLTPTSDRPKKRVFESALTLLPDDALDVLGLYRDDDGKIYTNKEATARGVSLFRDLPIPGLPLLDSISRGRLDTRFREASPEEAAFKQLSPIKSRELSAAERLRERDRTIKAQKKLKANKEELLKKSRKSKLRKGTRARRARRAR